MHRDAAICLLITAVGSQPPHQCVPHLRTTCTVSPPPDLLKFYGCELGAQTNFDKAMGTSIVNGAHDLRKLSELLEGFIKK